MTRITLYRSVPALAIALVAGLSACDEPTGTPLDVEQSELVAQHSNHASAKSGDGSSNGPDVSKWLAGLRRTTAPFHRIEAAEEAGWDTSLTPCLELPGTGGMGYHYGNVDLIDGVAESLAPEVLVYEPEKNGRLRLVAVEFIVPYALQPADGPAPSLHGVDFHHNDGAGLWVLHVWLWKNNPTGIFMDWNPTVSCQYAEAE